VRHAVGLAIGAVLVVATSGCTVYMGRSAPDSEVTSPAPRTVTVAPQPSPSASTTGCLVGDRCGEGKREVPAPFEIVCTPLPAAMTAFDEKVQGALPPGRSSDAQVTAALGDLTDLVIGVVDVCGYQVMVDVANQYQQPVYGWLRSTAVSALGEISALPSGKRCADLKALELGPKQAVDYWFLWGGPPLMDADLDGVPCETVWPDVQQYMPPYY
jgi:hypothetical protein